MKIFALIPLRKGSKRIKNKNLKIIKKKPLYKIVLDQTIKSKLIKKVFVATDIKNLKFKNKKISIFKRSKRSSSANAQTEIVIREFLKSNECDYLILIQATNVFLKTIHLDKALKRMIENPKFDSLLSVVNTKFFIWKKNNHLCKSLNYKLNKRPRSQDIKDKQLIENGSFYIFKRKTFLKSLNRLHGKITYFKMPKESLFEIDDQNDLNLVKKILN